MAQDTALVRQWKMLRILAARHYGVCVQELSQELSVTSKTIRRDLQDFQVAGFQLAETTTNHGKKLWKLKAGHSQPELNFALDEALALYLGRRFMEPLAGTMLWDAAQSAFGKIRACLGQAALKYLEKMACHLHHTAVGSSDYSTKADLIDSLMQGIEDRRAALIEYRSLQATESVTYEIHPYGLTYHRGSLYLVAHSRDHNELRHFKVDRIDSAEVGKFPFVLPNDFNLAEHLAKSFGVFKGNGEIDVTVLFLPRVARYVEEGRWHASQKLTHQRDGSVLAEFSLSSTEEIKRWILSFGPYAIVQSPPQLQDELRQELEAMAAHYPIRLSPTPSRKRAARAK